MSGNIASTTYTNIQSDITNLQNDLNVLTLMRDTNPGMSPDQRQGVNRVIAEKTQMLQNAQQRLIGLGSVFSKVYNQSKDVLSDQKLAHKIVSGELASTTTNLSVLEDTKNSKIRQVEINNYFAQKYDEQSQLMKIIIYTLVPIIILAIINKKINLLLPDNMYYILVAIIMLLGIFFFLKRLRNMLSRNNMNYQELNWQFDPSKAPPTNGKEPINPWANMSGMSMGTCFGSDCCVEDVQKYDPVQNKCVSLDMIESDTTTTMESFTVPRIFKKPDVTLEIEGGVQPYSSSAVLESRV
jgi:hypothetical protein